jgi:dihydrofolate synthase/folylpolyglutamate synthase
LPAVASPETVLSRLEGLGIRLGLARVRQVLAELGHPERRCPTVLVAGTNGKGSTAALLAAMAHAAGYRTGLYTSPHLEAVCERLRLNGRAIAPETLADLLDRVIVAAERSSGASGASGAPPTYFEALTLAAFAWFAGERVELAVLEVGMGGRLDATNAGDPVLSLIAPIGLDHREHLGATLGAIAREKAGILRPGRPALAWIEEREPAAAVADVAREMGADLRFASSEVELVAANPAGWSGQRVELATPERGYQLDLALLGRHQARNLALAVRAAEALRDCGFARLTADAVAAGSAACRWPGRLEAIDLPSGQRLVLDAAHNAHGAASLAGFLDQSGVRPDLVFGVFADKDWDDILGLLAPRVGSIVLTRPDYHRAKDPAELAQRLAGRAAVSVEPESATAVDRALASGAGTVLVCGSIYLLGEVRTAVRRRFGVPAAADAISLFGGGAYIKGS